MIVAKVRVLWSVEMHRFWLAAAMLGSASVAQAADMPVLRGGFTDGLSAPAPNWEGTYVGGQVGYEMADMDFSHAGQGLTDFMLRNSVLQAPVSKWSLLTKEHAQGIGFGAFVGSNWQLEDAVVGLEINYNHMNDVASSSGSSMSRLIVNPDGENAPAGHVHTYDTTLEGAAAARINDVATFRARAGWAGGNFMPYLFGGAALGYVTVSRSSTVSYNKYDTYTDPVTGAARTDYLGSSTQTQAEDSTSRFVVGYTAGLGVEYAVLNNLFLRGEWEYVHFVTTKDISLNTNTFRLGAGYKF